MTFKWNPEYRKGRTLYVTIKPENNWLFGAMEMERLNQNRTGLSNTLESVLIEFFNKKGINNETVRTHFEEK